MERTFEDPVFKEGQCQIFISSHHLDAQRDGKFP